MYLAKTGVYSLYTLKARYNGRALPDARIIDMKQELRAGNDLDLSRELEEGIRDAILDGKQSILFLNRRGNSRYLVCMDCGDVPQCPRCSVHLTYHSSGRRLMCHYCGYSEPARARCPKCGGALKAVGSGTQKIEQELRWMFPDTEILRMDADTVTASNSHEQLLRRFEEEKIPILLGTQMVTKGLDFENVTLVGVLDADQSLYAQDYRARERTFSLITQVVGRAGRRFDTGRAVIQTYSPTHPVILTAARQDYEKFYESEMETREALRCPPVCAFTVLTAAGEVEQQVLKSLLALKNRLLSLMEGQYADVKAPVLGPAAAQVVKVMGRYRYHLTMRARDSARFRGLVSGVLREFMLDSRNRGVTVFADSNPDL